MTVQQLVNSFNTTYVDNWAYVDVNFYINGKSVLIENARYNTQLVKSFHVAPYSDGSIRVDIVLEG